MYKQPTFSSSGRGTTWNVLKCLHCYNWRIISPIICRKKKCCCSSALLSLSCILLVADLCVFSNNTTTQHYRQSISASFPMSNLNREWRALSRERVWTLEMNLQHPKSEERERGSITIKYNEEMSEEEVASGANCRAEEASISPHGDLDNSATREAIK